MGRFASRAVGVLLGALLLVSGWCAGELIKFEKASFKVTHVQGGERLQRIRVATDASSVKQIGAERVTVHAGDSIAVQASFVDEKGEAASVHQAFVRFENKETGTDNIYILRRKGRDMKGEIAMSKEIAADLEFWEREGSYRVEVIYGDVRLAPSGTWVVTDDMGFAAGSDEAFRQPAGGVFDFDVGVKKRPLPEFTAAAAAGEARAHAAVVAAGTAGVAAPLVVLLVTWARMGAFRLHVPETGRAAAVGLHACVVAHAVALGMFWWRWNIVTTWKVMGALMVPTVVFGRAFLRAEKR